MTANRTSTSWGFRVNEEITDSLLAICELGGGDRYEAYEAWDTSLFCRVFVKLLRPHRVGDERARSSLAAEAEIALRLAHPNLDRLLRWSAAPPRPHLVLELITARSVEAHLDDIGPVSVPEACLLGLHVLSALRYLHAQNVLHLDVKPANVTMGDPPRLLDLSLAHAGPALRLDRRVGTPAYMAPEQCRQEPLTGATDLFGLGATLYEALSGVQAFSDPDPDAVDFDWYPQLAEAPSPLGELLSGVPRQLEAVVMGCLARDPAARPPAADVADVLAGVLESLGVAELLPWPRVLRARQ